jgi:tetratricopeptide (TPR) repeat protein
VAKSGRVGADAGPAPDAAANDANSYRQRGSAAYRDGELHRAIANFDQAIQLDPTVADVYIDRAIAFYRLQQFDRAFADIAEAKRIGNARRTTPDLQAARKTSPSTAKD